MLLCEGNLNDSTFLSKMSVNEINELKLITISTIIHYWTAKIIRFDKLDLYEQPYHDSAFSVFYISWRMRRRWEAHVLHIQVLQYNSYNTSHTRLYHITMKSSILHETIPLWNSPRNLPTKKHNMKPEALSNPSSTL